MSRERLAAFLVEQQRVAEEHPSWFNGRMPLQQHTYISRVFPPETLISSARAILFHKGQIMVIRDHKNEPYIIPGGRRDPGETVEETLRRELLEEVGWTVRALQLLGFIHFRHLGSKPDNYVYPFPDFIQVVYTAVADTYQAEALVPDKYVTSSRFHPETAVQQLDLRPGQRALLQAAIAQVEVR